MNATDPRHLSEHYTARAGEVFHGGATGRDLAVELSRHLLPWAQERVAAGLRRGGAAS